MLKHLLLLSTFALTCLVATPRSFAQDAEVKIVGPVASKSATAITITSEDKKAPSQTFVITGETKVSRGRTPITIEAVEVGETAGVVGIQQEGKLVATLISVRAK